MTPTVVVLYVVVIFLLIVGSSYIGKKVKSLVVLEPIYWIFFLFLVIFATFRDSSMPDYGEYMNLFHSNYNNSSEDKEISFYYICSLAKFLSPFNGEYFFLFIYAVLGIGIKYYAIKKYSPHVVFSLCIWLSSFFILHDLIQIRAAVTSGLLLFFLPQIQKRKIIKAIIIFLIAFFFHYSAIVFLPIFFINSRTIKWQIWTSCYVILLLINIFNIDISIFINRMLELISGGSVNSRLAVYVTREYAQNEEQVSMFAPYILFQSLVCFISLFSIQRLSSRFPYAIIWLKCCFLSIYIYSLSIPGVSMRLAELLSIPQIFLVPLLIDCFSNKYKQIGVILVSVICISWLTYFTFFKNLFSIV